MKCSICDGDGVITFSKMDKNGYFNDAFFMKECSACHGTGEVQTNEEWFDTLSTEEKADFFCTVQNCLTIYGDHIATHEDWVKWLKEKHESEGK